MELKAMTSLGLYELVPMLRFLRLTLTYLDDEAEKEILALPTIPDLLEHCPPARVQV